MYHGDPISKEVLDHLVNNVLKVKIRMRIHMKMNKLYTPNTVYAL